VIPKRTFWMTVGYGAGVASSVYVRRRVRRAVGPRTLDAAGRARGAVRGVRVAVSEGRAAMRDTERELRAEFQPSSAAPRSASPSGSAKRNG
jgi:hypothetical protein